MEQLKEKMQAKTPIEQEHFLRLFSALLRFLNAKEVERLAKKLDNDPGILKRALMFL